MLDKIPSTATYWSFPNGSVYEYRKKLELPQSLVNAFYDYDDREISLALDSVKYFTINKSDKGIIPNGFYKINESIIDSEEYNVYDTQNVLPIIYQYDKKISADMWENLNPIDKEEIMLTNDREDDDNKIIEENNQNINNNNENQEQEEDEDDDYGPETK